MYNKKPFNKKNYLWIIVVFFLDFSTKQYIIYNIPYNKYIKLLNNINITCIYNYGISFNILSIQQLWQYYLLVFVSLLMIMNLLYKIYKFSKKDFLSSISYIIITGGALGNFIDRLSKGYIVDFIDFHVKNWHFPVFNCADISIFIGVMLLFITCIKKSNLLNFNKN